MKLNFYANILESKQNKDIPELLYHGTSNFGFEDFNKHDVNYFTANYEYAKKYMNSISSALRSGKVQAKKGIYTVSLLCKNIFDTKNNKKHLQIFNDFTNNYGNGTPVSPTSGYPDWTDAENLAEYFDEKKLKFDCIIIQENLFNEKPIIAIATIGKNKVKILKKEEFN